MLVEQQPIDRSRWGSGPWDNEPDRIEFEEHGFPCLMRRTSMGNWCGYVAVPPGHPAYEKKCDDLNVGVHGGLTYAAHCQGEICHVPKAGEPDDVWWLGFDTAHCYDLIPLMAQYYGFAFSFPDMIYRDESYVRAECKELAEQLAAMVAEKEEQCQKSLSVN